MKATLTASEKLRKRVVLMVARIVGVQSPTLKKEEVALCVRREWLDGVQSPARRVERIYGWILKGDGSSRDGTPMVWQVAKMLGIWSGSGSSGQCHVALNKLKIP